EDEALQAASTVTARLPDALVLAVVEILVVSGDGELDAVFRVVGVAGRDQVAVGVVAVGATQLIGRGVDGRADAGAAGRALAGAAGEIAEWVVGLGLGPAAAGGGDEAVEGVVLIGDGLAANGVRRGCNLAVVLPVCVVVRHVELLGVADGRGDVGQLHEVVVAARFGGVV